MTSSVSPETPNLLPSGERLGRGLGPSTATRRARGWPGSKIATDPPTRPTAATSAALAATRYTGSPPMGVTVTGP
ncbi:MAG: hypothetical protein ABW133_22470, partial [Polyangiaceae bacterium]